MTECLDVSKIISEIKILKEKINKLEEDNININKEISQIKEIGEKNKKNNNLSIEEIKNRQNEFENLMSKNLLIFKNEINNHLINIHNGY